MCGITGILHFGRQPDAPRRVVGMATSIAHRGPDDDGFWSDQDVSLGFRRLSILDIESGAQPMSNEVGTVWVANCGANSKIEDTASVPTILTPKYLCMVGRNGVKRCLKN